MDQQVIRAAAVLAVIVALAAVIPSPARADDGDCQVSIDLPAGVDYGYVGPDHGLYLAGDVIDLAPGTYPVEWSDESVTSVTVADCPAEPDPTEAPLAKPKARPVTHAPRVTRPAARPVGRIAPAVTVSLFDRTDWSHGA